MFYRFILISLFLYNTVIFATPISIDSLKTEYRLNNSISAKKKILIELCENSRMLNIDTFDKYSNELKKISSNTDIEEVLTSDYYRLIYFYKRGELDSVNQLYQKNTEKLDKNTRNFLGYNFYYGCYLVKKNKFKESINIQLNVLKQAEFLKDTLFIMASKNGVGWAYMELFQLNDAISWFHKSKETSKNEIYLKNASSIYNNIASCYGTMGNFDSAKYYNLLAIQHAEQNKDLTALANAYFIKGNIYIMYNNYIEAERYFIKGYDIHKEYGDPFFIVSDMANLAIHYANMGMTNQGIQLAKESIKFAETHQLNGKLFIAYESLSVNYEKSGQYKLFAQTLQKMSDLKDSTYKQNSENEIAEMNAKYEMDKKENIIHLQELELNKKNILLVGGVLFLILSSSLVFVAYRNYKHKQDKRLQFELIKVQDQSTKAVIEAEENERKRLAADLHDGIGQLLTAARLNMEALKNRLLHHSEEDLAICEKAFNLVDESCKELRNVSHNIMPQSLIKFGLGNALKDFIEKIEHKDLSIHLNTYGISEINKSNIELFVYRIIQESINNVIKHSKASQLDISIIHDSEGLRVSIEDNGIGFNLIDLEKQQGIGMKNIKARIEFLKGTLDIDSKPGKGTLIAFYIPNLN